MKASGVISGRGSSIIISWSVFPLVIRVGEDALLLAVNLCRPGIAKQKWFRLGVAQPADEIAGDHAQQTDETDDEKHQPDATIAAKTDEASEQCLCDASIRRQQRVEYLVNQRASGDVGQRQGCQDDDRADGEDAPMHGRRALSIARRFGGVAEGCGTLGP